MIKEEKLMMKLLRDYFICKLYTQSSISSRNISGLTGVSISVAKRALHIREDRREDCIRLLPQAFARAIHDGVLNKEEQIDEETLALLQAEVEVTTLELQNKNKWASSSIELGSTLINTIKKINNKYCTDKRDIKLTKIQVIKLINSGSSFQEAADTLGISKTTAHNYYKKGINDDEDTLYQEEIHARKR